MPEFWMLSPLTCTVCGLDVEEAAGVLLCACTEVPLRSHAAQPDHWEARGTEEMP